MLKFLRLQLLRKPQLFLSPQYTLPHEGVITAELARRSARVASPVTMRALRESAPKVSAATHHTYEKQTPYLRLTYTYVTEPRNSATGRHFTTRSISSPYSSSDTEETVFAIYSDAQCLESN